MRLLRTSRHALVLVALPLAGFAPRAAAQESPASDTSWDITKPRGQTRKIDFRTSEGTWMSVDLTPDGRWVVFDMLGQIWRVPSSGGDAECLTQSSGIAVNFHPRVSPDGKSIAFVTDRKGNYNVWLMDIDGKNPRPVAVDPAGRYMFPEWSADGRFIVSERSVNLFDRGLWMLHKDGGRGTELLKGEIGKLPSRPVRSPDGKSIYYEVYTSRPNGTFGQDDILKGAYQLAQMDLASGDVRMLTSGTSEQQDRATSGGYYAQEISPDGKSLSFIRRIPDGTTSYKGHKFGPRSSLWVRDLASGAERMVMDPVEQDMAEASIPVDGVYPRYKWTADGKSIVLLQGGKIRRLDVGSGAVTTIPFTAHVQREISEQALAKFKVSDGPVDVHYFKWQSRSPDGKSLAFQAVGRVWIADGAGGTARRLTGDDAVGLEYAPTWAPDGKSVVYATWDDARRGALWRADVGGGRRAPVRLTRDAGEYINPAFSPDGSQIIVMRGAGVTSQGRALSRNSYYEIVRIAGAGQPETVIARADAPDGGFSAIGRPSFGPDGRIYFTSQKSAPGPAGRPVGVAELTSVRPDGSDRRAYAQFVFSDDVQPSPDGRWVAFTHAGDVFLAPLPLGATAGAVPVVDKNDGVVPVRRVSTEGGLFPHWRSATTLDYGSGSRFYSYDVETKRTDTTKVQLTVPRAIPKGSVALTGARIVTLENGNVIERGTVVAKDGRITCVGECSTSGVAKVFDVKGATIIPGWIDMHAHHHREHAGVLPAHNFETAIYLAYGVTTTLDPAAASNEVFPSAELVEAGGMLGPRIFTTAEPFYNGEGMGINDMTSLDVAIHDAARRRDWGAVSVKQYLQPRRDQRQWVVEAAKRAGLRATAEGSADLAHKLGMAMDGHTGFEHPIPLAPIYGDVTTFLGQTHTFNSYTPLVSGFGPWNEEYFWQDSDLWKDAKAQRWLPWRQLIPHTRRHMIRPVTDYPLGILAQGVTDIIAAGGYGAVGSHGQEHGIGSHWDVWIAAKAMGPMKALEMASLHGAKFLGMDADLGSIAVGKLADLMVLNANPLENIRNTANIRYVMKAGSLYDAMSLDELWPTQKKYGDYYWVTPEMYLSNDKPVGIWDKK